MTARARRLVIAACTRRPVIAASARRLVIAACTRRPVIAASARRLVIAAGALLCLSSWAIAGGVTSAGAGGITSAGAASSCPWMNASLSPGRRAHELVSAMTIDQKIAMLSQAQPLWAHFGAAGFIPGQASLCIPDLVLNDAGQGVGDKETGTTAFPAPIAQSSSWDPALQRKFGAACRRSMPPRTRPRCGRPTSAR